MPSVGLKTEVTNGWSHTQNEISEKVKKSPIS